MRRSGAPLHEREFRFLFAGRTISLAGGAALAGFLVSGFGPGWAIAVDAGTYLLGGTRRRRG